MHALALLLLAAAAPPAAPDEGGGAASRASTSTTEQYGYREGSLQLFFYAPPYTAQYTINTPTNIKGFAYTSDGRGLNTISFGVSGGFGYCLTSLLEFGGAIAFNLQTTSASGGGGSATGYDFALEPFVKFNFASTFGTGPVNPIIMVGPVFGLGQAQGGGFGGQPGTTGVIGADIDLGAEFFIGKQWGITGFVPIDIIDTAGYGNVNFTIGVGFGFFGYLGNGPIEIKL
jgi:hypothetical protein